MVIYIFYVYKKNLVSSCEICIELKKKNRLLLQNFIAGVFKPPCSVLISLADGGTRKQVNLINHFFFFQYLIFYYFDPIHIYIYFLMNFRIKLKNALAPIFWVVMDDIAILWRRNRVLDKLLHILITLETMNLID